MKYVLTNWKMYPTVDRTTDLLDAIQRGLRARSAAARPRVIVCPPFVALVPLRAAADPALVALGAQTCHWEQEGPYTGEISPTMLRGLVDYVMVGHRERRAAGETDDHVARKVAAVARAGLAPILFVGEDDRDGDHRGQPEARLRRGVSGIDVAAQRIVVVYEPAWAIGAENAAPAAHVAEAVEHLKHVLHGLGQPAPTVLYGGSVDDRSTAELAALDVLDGLGATRAGLDPDRFFRIIDAVGSSSAAPR